jgi:protein-S-isoprenylcysteine O-methyltransferase Ste14
LSESISDGISNFDLTEVIDNVKGDGNAALFERGELYFVAQAVLLLLIAIGGVPLIDQPLRVLGGPGLILGGLGIGGLAVLDLGSDSLSPFPSPPDDGDLKTSGIYSKMRHPMYTSLLMISCGLAIFSNSADRLLYAIRFIVVAVCLSSLLACFKCRSLLCSQTASVGHYFSLSLEIIDRRLTAILAYLLEIKSSKEEDFLVGKYGIYYTQYMEEVPGKFLPADLIGSLPWNKKGDA